MRQPLLSPRLTFIANIINPCECFADIGTDHGYLPYDLFVKEKIYYAILCDINNGPLNNARKTFMDTPFAKSVDYRLGSGLSVIKENEVNAFAIAGMGGSLIKMILTEDFKLLASVNQFVLQPMTEQDELRKWLIENDYSNFLDYYVLEGDKLYEIIVHENATIDKNDIFNVSELTNDLEFGYHVHIKTQNTYRELLTMKRRKYNKILRATSSLSDEDERRQICFNKLATIDLIEEALLR